MHPVTLLFESAEKYPASLALRSLDASAIRFTYAELVDRVRRIANTLRAQGISTGDRIALSADNSPFWGAAYYGIMAAGATVVPFDVNLPIGEIDFILKDSGTVAWIGNDIAFSRIAVAPSNESIKRIPIRGDFSGALPIPQPILAPTAAIVYTSGTTGVAKGVMLSGEALAINALGAIERIKLIAQERFFSVLPMYHTYECTAGLILPLAFGGSVSYARSLKPNEMIADAEMIRPTVMLVVPLLLEKIRNGIFRKAREASWFRRQLFHLFLKLGYATAHSPGKGLGVPLFRSVRRRMGFDQMKYLVSGGAALPHSVERDLMALGFPLIQGYGLTECAPLVSVNSPDIYSPGSVGRPMYYAEARIEDPDSEGVGMLYTRGKMVMQGYWNNPQATAEALTLDGWLRTGDLARIDEKGCLHIVGRRKDVIVTAGGKNVYPETLEQVILEDERVLETVVIGRQRKQGHGEEIGAILVFNPDWIATEAENGKTYDDDALQRLAVDICAGVNDGQPDYRKITRIEFSREELEKTTTRKIRRFKYRNCAST